LCHGGSCLQETGRTSQRRFVALGLQYTTRESARPITVGGLTIKNYEKLRTDEETGFAYVCRRTGLNGEALKEKTLFCYFVGSFPLLWCTTTLSSLLFSPLYSSSSCSLPSERILYDQQWQNLVYTYNNSSELGSSVHKIKIRALFFSTFKINAVCFVSCVWTSLLLFLDTTVSSRWCIPWKTDSVFIQHGGTSIFSRHNNELGCRLNTVLNCPCPGRLIELWRLKSTALVMNNCQNIKQNKSIRTS
jgi:hypothetical protein